METVKTTELTSEQKIDRLWDIQEIRNLMARYVYYGYARNWEQVPALFAQRADSWVDCEGFGIFDGQEGIERFFVQWHHSMEGDALGMLSLHTVTTEMIEVAGDGQTARALWVSPGIESRRVLPTEELESFWIWGLYAIDFIREDGRWKFWHFRIPHLIQCDYHHSWNDLDSEPQSTLGGSIANNGRPKVDRPSSFEPAFYRGDKKTTTFFEPPTAYETYTDIAEKWVLG